MSLRNISKNYKFTYYLYLLYRLYYKAQGFKKKKFYGQWKEDLEIVNFFNKLNIKNGKYLDIGCYHPFNFSNTCLLYKSGWSGINIDLNQTSIDLFNIARKRDINICACLSDKEKEIEIYFDSPFSPINTTNKNFFKNFTSNDPFQNAYKNHTKIYKKTRTVDEILEKNKDIIKNKINYLNIDIEGSDYEVLRTIDLKKFDIDLISIETHTLNNMKSDDYNHINNYFNNYGYKFYKKVGLTSLYHS
jgi:hypothetical protein